MDRQENSSDSNLTGPSVFERDLMLLKKNVYRLMRTTGISCNEIMVSIHKSLGILESLALDKFYFIEDKKLLMQELEEDSYLYENGFVPSRSTKERELSTEFIESFLNQQLAILQHRMEQIHKRLEIHPIFLGKKLRDIFNCIAEDSDITLGIKHRKGDDPKKSFILDNN